MAIINHWRNRETGCLVLAQAGLPGLAAIERNAAAGDDKTSNRVDPVHRDRCWSSVTIHVLSNGIKIANSLANVKLCFVLCLKRDLMAVDKTARIEPIAFWWFHRMAGSIHLSPKRKIP
jgi:hypothetical protein